MKPIPTILGPTENIKTGPTAPYADASAFGAGSGLGNLANSLNGLSESISITAKQQQRVEDLKKEQDEHRWMTSNAEQIKRTFAEWLANPDNLTEDVGKKWMEFSQKEVERYSKTSPSTRAWDGFNGHIQSFITSRYDQALDAGEKIRIGNIDTETVEATQNALQSFNLSGDTAGLTQSYFTIQQNIEKNFGQLAPKKAAQEKQELIEQFALGTLSQNPAFARDLVEKGKFIDEQRRVTLLDQIKRAENTFDVVERDKFNQERENRVNAAELGKPTAKIPLGMYESAFSKQEAIIHKRRDDQRIDAFATANKVFESVADKNATTQQATLLAFRDKVSSDDDKAAFNAMSQRVTASIEMQAKNPVAWLVQNNPEVKLLADRASKSTVAERESSIRDLNNAKLKYQGFPNDYEGEINREQYLYKPTGERHLMDIDDAKAEAQKINTAAPADVVKMVNEFMQRYPGDDHQSQAFNDLVSLGKLRQEYQFIFLNKDKPWNTRVIGAVAQSDAIEKLGDETNKKDVKSYLDSNPTWTALQRSMLGDNAELASEMSGYKKLVSSYALGQTLAGTRPKDAVNSAVQQVVGEHIGFAQHNGQTMAIFRDMKNGRAPLSDNDISQIPRNLSAVLDGFDVSKINRANFPTLTTLSKGTSDKALKDLLQSRGYAKTESDGRAVTLYITDDYGAPMQLTDKEGKPFLYSTYFLARGNFGGVEATPPININ